MFDAVTAASCSSWWVLSDSAIGVDGTAMGGGGALPISADRGNCGSGIQLFVVAFAFSVMPFSFTTPSQRRVEGHTNVSRFVEYVFA